MAGVLWQHRMNLLKAEAKYADVMELTLYNGMLGGIAVSGDAFFYQNPLESRGAERRTWIGLACCPTNFARIIPQVGGFAYATKNDDVYVNLFISGKAAIALDGGKSVTLQQETAYPWDSKVKLTVVPGDASEFAVRLRIPGWALGRPIPSDLYRYADSASPPVGLKVGGEKVDAAPEADGYVRLRRLWKPGDVVELDLPMPVRRVYAHPNIQGNRGKISLMRGPIIYCFEGADNPDVVFAETRIPVEAQVVAEHRGELLGGLTVLRTEGRNKANRPVALTAIPYYAWANRAKGPMTVWMEEEALDKY
jgi:DUF1680 family protein